jgi:D-lactate dehydrogenase
MNGQGRLKWYTGALSTLLHDDELERLLTFPNVLIPSHQVFLAREALAEIARTTVANISALAGPRSFVKGSVVT